MHVAVISFWYHVKRHSTHKIQNGYGDAGGYDSGDDFDIIMELFELGFLNNELEIQDSFYKAVEEVRKLEMFIKIF